VIQLREQISCEIQSYVAGRQTGRNGAELDRESIEAHVRACTFCGSGAHRAAAEDEMTPPLTSIWETIEAALRAEGRIRDDE